MTRYVYSVVRFVPNPTTGEFINVGAIAGSEQGGDWSVRHIENDRRARGLGPVESLSALYNFLNQVGYEIDMHEWAQGPAPEGDGTELSEGWLSQLHRRHNNIVQLTAPAPMVAETAEEALDIVFDQMIIDPLVLHRDYATRHRVISQLRASYLRAGVGLDNMRRRATLHVGDLRAPVDFVVANGHAVQLAHTWSFQIEGQSDLSRDVKSFGYTVERLRDGQTGLAFGGGEPLEVDPEVNIDVVYAPPRTRGQEEAFAEARQVFEDTGVRYVTVDRSDEVGAEAESLLQEALGSASQLPSR